MASALVEAQAFAFVYAATGPRQLHGDSALIDLHSDAEAAEVLGAALLSGPRDSVGSQLLVLFSDELKVYSLK